MGDGMTRQGTFTFNGISSRDYSLWLTGAGVYGAPARKYESVSIPGRNGTLTMDGGAFEDIEHTYKDCFIASEDAATALQGLRNALMSVNGKARLTDDYNADEFYLARYMRGLDPDVAPLMKGAKFDLVFSRDPRRFLASGENVTTLTESGTITNPTLYPSRPLLRVYGTGNLSVGDVTITINYADSYTDIDCEIMDAYKGAVNCNPYIELSGNDFPTLKAGSNGITLGTGITRVIITPRWYRL